jgi:hypothetical protein
MQLVNLFYKLHEKCVYEFITRLQSGNLSEPAGADWVIKPPGCPIMS